ncbi:ataxin-10 [Cucurbita maxima]|uniref:Ataxin-10 n=1 Tax=Cucurbita maxima TaxID=3661 RepID=A0A6J1KWY2_CUCMA|nr:ataxin-10 [Cucurbita maxima]XP_023006848.1 ataxin-10 [Cucurbita maxima]XP_023006849.1 ataxin-10 [Cucurbita maxima]
MKNSASFEQSIPERITQPLFSASNSCTLETSLETLIEASKSVEGRSNFTSQNILPCVLELIQCLDYISNNALQLSSLRLLRNLCAGEIRNQNVFIEQNGVGVVSSILQNAMLLFDPDRVIIRLGLQVLANVSLAGEEHQQAIWCGLFPDKFVSLARIRYCEISDPLSMILYNLCSTNSELVASLCSDVGLPIIEEITRTTSLVGFKEDWVKLLLSRICLEEPNFTRLFSALHPIDSSKDGGKDMSFSSEQAFLLTIISEILNERIGDISIPKDFASCIHRIFQSSIPIISSTPICERSLPTGRTAVDVLGYSLNILRDICAQDDGKEGGRKDVSEDAVDVLLCLGLIDLLLGILRDIEPPAIVKKAIQQAENENRTDLPNTSKSCPCPYKGFRRDIVAVIANCLYRKKHVQDDIRKKNGVFVLLQQCVVDENNPFLREWGIWAVRNLLEGNLENKKLVAELEVQGPVNMPEIAELGLQVEVDPKTKAAKLVNATRPFKDN